MPTGVGRTRRTQAERTAAMRTRLLDATVECLVTYGYAGTTTPRIAEIADLGERLVDHEDMTVYLLSRDVPAVEYDEAESVCVGGCADKWAAVPPGDELVGAGLDEAYLGSLTRDSFAVLPLTATEE